jgi:hypothetical protein
LIQLGVDVEEASKTMAYGGRRSFVEHPMLWYHFYRAEVVRESNRGLRAPTPKVIEGVVNVAFK